MSPEFGGDEPDFSGQRDVIILETILSCSALNFVRNRLSDQDLMTVTLAALPVIKNAGFDYAEIYLREVKESELGLLLTAAQEQGLKIQSVHYCKPLLKREMARSIDLLLRSIAASVFLGASLGVLHPPAKCGMEASLEITRKLLDKVLPRAEEQGIVLTLENLNGPGYFALLGKLIEEFPSPSLGITMDLKFLHASGNTMEEYFRALGTKVVNIHVNEFRGNLVDSRGRRQYPPLGVGEVDFEELSRLIRQYRYSRVLTLETCLNEGRERQELARARTLMLGLGKGE